MVKAKDEKRTEEFSVQSPAKVPFQVDPRLVYLLVALALAIPLITGASLRPARMESAESFYKTIDGLDSAKTQFVLIAADWGPGTSAENAPQTAVAIEHLMRKHIPFAVVSLYPLSEPFLRSVPEKIAAALEKEMPGQHWEYGKDWVNWGFRFGGQSFVQGVARSGNIHEQLGSDAFGTPIEQIPCMKSIHSLKDINLLIQITGLVGVFNTWIQFFQDSSYRPPVLHGCTSITIPEAFIYLSSGQILGLHEGIAGAAWYDQLLTNAYPDRQKSSAISINSGVSYAHLIILAFIVLGNISYFLSRSRMIAYKEGA